MPWNKLCTAALAKLWVDGMVSPKSVSTDDIDPAFDLSPVFKDNGVSILRFRSQFRSKAGDYMRAQALQGRRRGESAKIQMCIPLSSSNNFLLAFILFHS
jgi:hypothetical protein